MNTEAQSNTAVVLLDDIETVTRRALQAHGAAETVAAQVAHAVRVAEANGNRICGLYYLESYCQQLRSGRVDGRVEPVVTHDKAGVVRVDAKFGFAQSAFAAGFDTAVAATIANGTCGYAVEHSHTCTSLGYFTEQFAKAGLIAIGATNSTARVAPPGGSRPLLGTNPIAMAVPGPDSEVAFQFDFSTSAVALGKITMAAAAGTRPHRLGRGRERQRHDRPRGSIARITGFCWRVQGLRHGADGRGAGGGVDRHARQCRRASPQGPRRSTARSGPVLPADRSWIVLR